MLTVQEYLKIRTGKRDGMSIRAICRTYHHSHHTIRKALNHTEPPPYTRTKPPKAPVLAQVPQLGDRGKFFSLFLIGESCFLGQINGSPAGS
jgi:transposase